MDFVYPYYAAGARGNELQFSTASVKQHFKGEAKITLIGDCPKWWKGQYIPVPRVRKQVHRGFKDTLNKLVIACKTKLVGPQFVWMMDDVFFVKQTSLDQIKAPLCMGAWTRRRLKTYSPKSEWLKLKKKTLSKVNKTEALAYDYATHLPQFVEKKKVLDLVGKHNLFRDMHLWEILYGNKYRKKPRNTRSFFYRFTDPTPQDVLELKFKSVHVVNSGNRSWDRAAENALSKFIGKENANVSEKLVLPSKAKENQQLFIEFLQNKSIAVVGNGLVVDKGQKIDEHDVVIRFNNFEIQNHNYDVGTRTTVWAHCSNDDVKKRSNPSWQFEFDPHPHNPKKQLSNSILIAGDLESYNTINAPHDKASTGLATLNWLHYHGLRFQTFGFDHFKHGHYFNLSHANNWHDPVTEESEFKRLQIHRRIEAVIPFRFTPSRYPAFEHVLDWALKRFDVVHTPTAEGSQIFNKSALLNEGARQCQPNSLILLLDADTILEDQALRKSISLARSVRSMIKPFNKIVKLTEFETESLLSGNPQRVHSGEKTKAPGGATLIRKSVYDLAGGHDENFLEWGGEDNAFRASVQAQVGRQRTIQGDMIHLFHEINEIRPRANLIRYKQKYQKQQKPAIELIKRLRPSDETNADFESKACHRIGEAIRQEKIRSCVSGKRGQKATVYRCKVRGTCSPDRYKARQADQWCRTCSNGPVYRQKPKQVIKTRMALTDLLGPESVAIELGVATGRFSEQILESSNVSVLYSIDMWAGDRGHNGQEMRLAKQRLARFGSRSKVIQLKFKEALGRFKDRSVDFIYIDGYAHEGNEHGETMKQWWPKLKSGAVMAGHDYSEKWPLTVKAVDDFFGNGHPFWMTTEDEIASFYSFRR